MSIHYRIVEEKLILVGHTFPHKETIKAMGGRFNGQDKVWFLSDSPQNRESVDGFCRRMGGGPLDAMLTPFDADTSVVAVVDGNPAANETDLTLRQLMVRVQTAVTGAFPVPVWVVGEIQNVQMRPSGVFLNLAEAKHEDAGRGASMSIKATLWNSRLAALNQRYLKQDLSSILQDGLAIRALVQVNVYQDRGQISLDIFDIDANYTKGAMALAREALLRELRASGLAQKNKQTFLTSFPLRIGLISANGSRAKSDFLHQLEVGNYPGLVLFYAAPMQGEQTVSEVMGGLASLQDCGCDLIVVTRGGGSQADLRWFDDRELALAIANCPVPVIAAIGHHEDTCIAEEICFWREKTPTAAADFVLRQLQGSRDLCDNLMDRIALNWQMFYERALRVLQTLDEQLLLKCHEQLGRWHDRLHGLEKALLQNDPRPWLKKGWTQLWTGDRFVRSVDQVKIKDMINARLADGHLQLEVKKIEKDIPQGEQK